MENLHCSKITFSHLYVLLFHLLQFSSLSLFSSAYTLPEKYFINCGSDSTVTDNGRNFTGDDKSGSFAFSSGQSSTVTNTNSTTHASPLYQTARIFRKPSSYELQISQNGSYMVRFHFYAFTSPENLFNAQFNVSAAGFSLLSNFSVENTGSPVIEEFLFTLIPGKFTIYFAPSEESSFAFANAIEVFLAADSFIQDVATHVAPSGGNSTYHGLLSHALKKVYRINVGGPELTPENDTLWRNWVPDDDYLVFRDAAKNTGIYSARPNYQPGGASNYTAPDIVYRTAKEINASSSGESSFFNITWRFGVKKNASHFVRLHFCDIVSKSLNVIQFDLYLYSEFSQFIDPYARIPQFAVPFYLDFVLDSDYSGFINISIGPLNESYSQLAFLNGLEIMEMINPGSGLVPIVKKPAKKHLFLIVGSVVGGGAFLFILVAAVAVVGLKSRKTKPVEAPDWKSIPVYGSSYSRTSELTVNGGSPACNFYLGLKLSFLEIQSATNNFDAKLMIGEGGFGKVYRGTLRSGIKVAVKRSQPGHGQGLPEFQTEIMVLSKIRHRHLVSLIGYCDERSEMILVYEFMEKGTLMDHLYNLKGDFKKPSIQSELSWIKRLEICIGAAKGLHYLHTSSDRGIIHRDVKSTNILLDENYLAKVADFGLSRLGVLDQTHVSTDVKGSFGYLDPEYFRFLQLTQKSDVYSFGVVLLEVLCARPAIDNLLSPEQINLAEWGLSWQTKGQLERIIDPFLIGKMNPNSLRMFGEIVEKCLKEYGVDRPSMQDVLWDLEYALQLQQSPMHTEPHEEDSISWVLPVSKVQRLPSHNISFDEYDVPAGDFSDISHSNASEVFSQLRIDDAR